MIAVDSSAVLAVAFGEDEAEKLAPPLAGADCLVGWATVFEIQLVLSSRNSAAASEVVRRWLALATVTKVPFDESLCTAARTAFERYGRGRHPANLNFGDCMAYAVARVHDVPLLYKGGDFGHTDIRPALA